MLSKAVVSLEMSQLPPENHLLPTYSAPPDPLAGFKWPTSKGREGEDGRA